MCEDVFASIRSSYSKLTRVEKSIADYVLSNAEAVVGMSITRLSEYCNVSESSVFRLCRHIGCSGYHDFRMQLLLTIKADKCRHSLQEQNDAGDNSLDAQIQRVYLRDLSMLQKTYDRLATKQVQTAIEHMRKAERIMFIGVGTSLISVMDAYQRFLQVTSKVCCSIEARTQRMLCSTLSIRDVAIVFSYSGNTSETLLMAKKAKQNDAYLIGITHCLYSPLYQLCDQCFLCGDESDQLSDDNKIALLGARAFLLDTLCIAYRICSENEWDENSDFLLTPYNSLDPKLTSTLD